MPTSFEGWLIYSIVLVVSGIVVGIVLRVVEARVNLVWWSPQNFLHTLQEGDKKFFILTNNHTIQNLGGRTAHDVEVVHKSRPDAFQLQPSLPYEEQLLPGGEHSIKIKTLGPKEHFTIEIASYKAAPTLLYIRSTAGPAKSIQIIPQQVFPRWVNIAIQILLIIGLGTVVFLIGLVLRFIVKGVISG